MSSASDSLINYLRIMAGAIRDDPRGDAELLSQFAEGGDEAAFRVLVSRHGLMVWRTCQRVLGNASDVEDAFQSAFLTLARKARQSSIGNPAGWLHRVARQAALNVGANARRRRKLEHHLQEIAQPKVETDAGKIELSTALDEELENLPEKLRVPLVLRYLEEKTQDEVARILGCSRSVALRRLARGETLLRKRLERRGLAPVVGGLAALLKSADSAPAMPASLIGSTTRAAVAFRSGALNGVSAEAAEKLLHSLSLKGVMGKGWWLVLACVGALGLGRVGLVAWKMFGDGSGAIVPTTPEPAASMVTVEHCDKRVDLYGDHLPDGAIARIGTIRFRPDFRDRDWWSKGCVAFFPDGKSLVSVCGTKFISFWESATGKQLRRLEGPGKCNAVAVSPDGKKLACSGEEKIWLLDPGVDPPRVQFCCNNPNGFSDLREATLVFTSDGKKLAVGIPDKSTVLLLDAATGKLQLRFPIFKDQVTNAADAALTFSPDGTLLAIGNAVWNVTTAAKQFDLKVNHHRLKGGGFE